MDVDPLSEASVRSHQESVTVESSAESLYDLVSDISRTGGWSPVRTSCWWDDAAGAGQVGAWSTGRNELPNRTWQTRSEVPRSSGSPSRPPERRGAGVMTGLLGEVDRRSPIGERRLEDDVPGSVYEFGHARLSETQIVSSARRYDPQSIHTDPTWSATGPFTGLIASGVRTIAACMRLYVDHDISPVDGLASPGLGDLRWPRPVRPGDRPRICATVAGARASRSEPDRGLGHSFVKALDQDDVVVLSFTAMNSSTRRPVA